MKVQSTIVGKKPVSICTWNYRHVTIDQLRFINVPSHCTSYSLKLYCSKCFQLEAFPVCEQLSEISTTWQGSAGCLFGILEIVFMGVIWSDSLCCTSLFINTCYAARIWGEYVHGDNCHHFILNCIELSIFFNLSMVKVKVKVSVCFFNWAPYHEVILGEQRCSFTHSWPWH